MTLDKNQKREYSIEPYNPEWVKKFEKIKTLLAEVFDKKAITIEHIGSTSIPGIKAKPIIDVLVVVDKFEPFLEEKRKMSELGYEYGENYIEPNSLIFFKTENGNRKLENIHVCENGSFKAKQFIDERDFLRTHQEWIQKYSVHKEKLKAKFPNDYPSYREGKKSFFKELEVEVVKWKTNF